MTVENNVSQTSSPNNQAQNSASILERRKQFQAKHNLQKQKAANAAGNQPDPKQNLREAGISDHLSRLLLYERQLREAAATNELIYLLANEGRLLMGARQIFVLELQTKTKWRVKAVTGQNTVNAQSPFVRWIEDLTKEQMKNAASGQVQRIHPDLIAEGQAEQKYPFQEAVCAPLKAKDGKTFAAIVYFRERPWSDFDVATAERIAGAASHAWHALSPSVVLKNKLFSPKLFSLLVIAGVAGALTLPVPLTALAPAEITAQNPYLITAPIDGVIDSVDVEPNQRLKKGDTLFHYSNTEARNQMEVAERQLLVAQATLDHASRTALIDDREAGQVAIAKAEVSLKLKELQRAQDLLSKSTVVSPVDGVAVFTEKDQWTGKPVATGERVLHVADPKSSEIIIELPVSDAIVIKKGAAMRFFLDSEPLEPIDGVITSASYRPLVGADGVMSYRVKAKILKLVGKDKTFQTPRIGLRGTAEISTEDVSLGYFLSRKPLAKIRQWTGW